MAELNAPTMTETKRAEINFEAGMVEPVQEKTHLRQSRGLVIALPIHRTDLPAIALMLLAGSLIGWWSWTINQPNSLLASPDPSAVTWDPLLLSLLNQKAISLMLTSTVALLILAAALALSPLRWWAYLRFVAKTGIAAQWRQFQRRSPEPDDAEAWVAAQAAWLEEMQATVDQEQTAQGSAASEGAAVETSGQATGQTGEPAAGSPQSEAEQATDPAAQAATPATETAAQGAATPEATEQAATEQGTTEQEAATPGAAPAENAPQDAAVAAPDPNAPQPAAEKQGDAAAQAQPKEAAPKEQQPSEEVAALVEETKEEALDLADLTDVQDILNSFTDNDVISPELLALSASLDDIDLPTLQRQIHTVTKQLDQGMTSPQFFERIAAIGQP